MTERPRKIKVNALKDPVVLIGLGLGSGLSPKAPGTAGTLLAVPLYLSIQHLSLVFYARYNLPRDRHEEILRDLQQRQTHTKQPHAI